MNAYERQQRSLRFKSSQAVKQCEDWSNNPEYVNPVPLFKQPHNPKQDIRHGVSSDERTHIFSDTKMDQLDLHEYNGKQEFLDLADHPDCRPPLARNTKSEMAELFKDRIFEREDEHKHCLIEELQSEYAGVGKKINYGYKVDENEVCGASTKKPSGDNVAGAFQSAYEQKQYVLVNRGQLTPETIKRNLRTTFTEDLPQDKSKMRPAGLSTMRGESVQQSLQSNGYGNELPNFDDSMKVVKNLQDTEMIHGWIAKKDAARPACLGGPASENMMDYRRE